MVHRVRAMSIRLGPDVFRHQSLLPRPGDTAYLGEIAYPTLVIAVSADRLRSLEESEELHQGVTGSALRIVEGVWAHDPP